MGERFPDFNDDLGLRRLEALRQLAFMSQESMPQLVPACQGRCGIELEVLSSLLVSIVSKSQGSFRELKSISDQSDLAQFLFVAKVKVRHGTRLRESIRENTHFPTAWNRFPQLRPGIRYTRNGTHIRGCNDVRPALRPLPPG
jgi:hypothetical protein